MRKLAFFEPLVPAESLRLSACSVSFLTWTTTAIFDALCVTAAFLSSQWSLYTQMTS